MKKNLIICLFYIVAIAIVFYSCGSESSIETKNYSFEKKYYLTEDKEKGVLSVEMQVELPEQYKNQEVLNTIREDIVGKVFGNNYSQYPNKDVLPQFANDIVEEYKSNNLPFLLDEDVEEIGFAYNNDYLLETFALLNDECIFSYGMDLYVYMGGAHGISNRLYYNYNLKDGSFIEEDDLFTTGYEAFLTVLIKQQIVDDNDEITSIEDLDSIYWTEHIKPNGNFYITLESINYVFNPYEIAPYVYGHTETAIPFAKIKNILKENSLIKYLVGS